MSQRHLRDGRPYTGRSDPKYYTQEYFNPSYLSGDELRRHEHANPPRLPSINHPDRMRQDVHWYSPDTFNNMVESSRQPRRPTEGFEPFGRRGGSLSTVPGVLPDPRQHQNFQNEIPRAGHNAIYDNPHGPRLGWTADNDAAVVEYVRREKTFSWMAERLGCRETAVSTRWYQYLQYKHAAEGLVYVGDLPASREDRRRDQPRGRR